MSEIFSLISELENTVSNGSAEKREAALIHVTDMFIAGSGRYSSEQNALFDDIILTLASTIEMKARARLSRRLATIPFAPVKTVRSLAFDDSIAVAAPVLKSSTQLADDDLIANASTKSQGHLYAITQRQNLSEAVTDVLVERGDRNVVHAVAKNSGAHFSETGFGQLVARARGDEMLARYVGERRDIPRHHFVKLLETASATVRAKLEAANPELAATVREVVAEVAAGISDEVRNASRDHAKAKARIKRLYKSSQFGEADVHAFARAQNFEKTALALSVLGGIPIDLAERALLDQSPDMVLVLAKAAGCCWSTAKTILLMTAANRGMSAMDMKQAMVSFERLQTGTAKQALQFYTLRHKNLVNTAAPEAPAIPLFATA